MKKQIRVGVFETNSSSTHSISICSPEQLKELQDGTCLDESLVEDFADMNANDNLESYIEEYITPGGETIILFGNYGYDG